MSKSAQLKRKAAEFEQKRQYDRALATYAQAIEAAAGIPEELDIPLYNRVGDLHLRLGDLEKAVAYYETAVDLYAEGGFFNNAIALCNKVLRHSPGRTVIYYKLGKISAKKGFNSDAKQNFLEYAARMEKAGDPGEAFRALKEFADLCPGQDDVRLMLAEQLARADRVEDAIEQLQIVHEAMLAEERTAEATATLERIHALDPAFSPRTGMSRQQAKREGLVFLDVDYGKRDPSGAPEVVARTVRPLSVDAFDQVALPDAADEQLVSISDGSPLAGLNPVSDPLMSMTSEQERGPSPQIAEFESTSVSSGEDSPHLRPLDVEHTSFSAGSSSFSSETEPPEGVAGGVEADESEERGDDVEPSDDFSSDSISGVITGFVESLSSDVGSAEGGLPGDLGILPLEAIEEEQSRSRATSDDQFVDLNEWLLEGEPAPNPRMTAEDEDQSENRVQTDFSNMLATFKAGVAANVDESDSESHYDLGVAYMEMGLFDEAIAQFQKSMRGDATPERRVRAYESLGESFIQKNDLEVAISSLGGALREPGLGDTKLVGVLYLLGYASEKLGRWKDAEGYYRRVFAVDINFRDVGERLRRAENEA